MYLSTLKSKNHFKTMIVLKIFLAFNFNFFSENFSCFVFSLLCMWDERVCPIFRINFKKASNLNQEKHVPGELVNSETLKMVRDMDQHKDEDWSHQGIPAWNQVLQIFRASQYLVPFINISCLILMVSKRTISKMSIKCNIMH